MLGFSQKQSPSQPTSAQYFWTGTYTAHPGKRFQVLHFLDSFADEIVNVESDTLNYLVLIPADESEMDTLYLWERYSDEMALREVHGKSTAAQGLKDTIGPLLRDRAMARFRAV